VHYGRGGNFWSRSDALYRDEADTLLVSIGLRDQARALGGTLSYGNQKQLELGLALASDPQLLLLDEPTAGMSAGETRETMAIAEADEMQQIETIWGSQRLTRRRGEALHTDREPLDTLGHIRRTFSSLIPRSSRHVGAERGRKFADSALEEAGFEISVPRGHDRGVTPRRREKERRPKMVSTLCVSSASAIAGMRTTSQSSCSSTWPTKSSSCSRCMTMIIAPRCLSLSRL
jgi:hypothetical protein